jgi:glycolate oxidase
MAEVDAGSALLTDLRSSVADLKLLTDEVDRESYRSDETAHYTAGLPPAVALPTTTEEVSGIMRLATAHRIPVVPRGAGSGLSGNSNGARRR